MSNLKILLVEDAPHWRKILKNYISSALTNIKCNADICEAENMEKAWDMLENNQWDLLCTDIGLSEVPHENAGALLVSRSFERNIPTIIISGTPSVTPHHVRDFIKKDKVADFFYKQAFDKGEFIKLVEDLLTKKAPNEKLPIKVSIFYAHADNINNNPKKRWFDRFREMIIYLEQQNIIIIKDQDIDIGDEWHTAISDHLNETTAAVLFISPYFINSEYIANGELPVLLKNASIKGMKIIPIIVSPCMYNTAIFKYPDPKNGPEAFMLSSIQAVNIPSKSLIDMDEGEQNRVLKRVVDTIANLAGIQEYINIYIISDNLEIIEIIESSLTISKLGIEFKNNIEESNLCLVELPLNSNDPRLLKAKSIKIKLLYYCEDVKLFELDDVDLSKIIVLPYKKSSLGDFIKDIRNWIELNLLP